MRRIGGNSGIHATHEALIPPSPPGEHGSKHADALFCDPSCPALPRDHGFPCVSLESRPANRSRDPERSNRIPI